MKNPALACLCLTMLMPSLDTSIANASLPALAHALGASFAQVQWVVLAYLLAITSLIVGTGRLGDLLGRGRLLGAGVALFTLASLLCGLAPTLATLVAARALQGVGAAAMLALTVALVGETMPRERTGAAMGLLGTMSAIGTTLGPSLGGVLTTALGWRAVFLVNVPIGLVNLWLARRHLPMARPAGTTRPRLDLAGTTLLALALSSYALAATLGRGHAAALLGLAAAAMLAFVAVERRAVAPLVRLAMFRDPGLCAGLAATAAVATSIATTLVVGPFYLAGALALPAALVGLVLSCGPLVSALTGAPAGRLVDRVGATRMTLAGLAAMAAGALLLALLPAGIGLAGWLAGIVVLTIGYASFQAANNTALMHGADAAQRGLVSGLLSLARNLGLVTGVAVMGAVFADGAGDVTARAPSAIVHGMHRTFALDAALLLAALAIALAVARRSPATRRLPV